MKNIIITVASTGIGWQTAKYLKQKGYFVITNMRKKEDFAYCLLKEPMLKGLSQALRKELRDFSVKVILINPGLITSRFSQTGKYFFIKNIAYKTSIFTKRLHILKIPKNHFWTRCLEVNILKRILSGKTMDNFLRRFWLIK